MFPASILVGTYGAQGGGNGGNGGNGGGNTLTYDAFYTIAQPSGYVVEFNSKLYTFGLVDSGRIYESSDDGKNWSVTTAAGTNLSCAGATKPVVESNRILWVNGASNNNFLYEWDGTNAAASISTGLNFDSSTGITLFTKIGSYYYIGPGTSGELYRSTSLTSGWSSVTTLTGGNGHKALVESSGTFVLTTDASGQLTTNDWSTVTTPTNIPRGISLATDDNNNWLALGNITASDVRGRYSTDDAATWTITTGSMRPPGEASGNLGITQDSLIYLSGKWIWLSGNGGFNSLISTTNPFVASPTTVLEKDFVNNTYNLNKINNTILVSGYNGSSYGVHRLTISPAQVDTFNFTSESFNESGIPFAQDLTLAFIGNDVFTNYKNGHPNTAYMSVIRRWSGSREITQEEAKQIAGWFAQNDSMQEDVWAPVALPFNFIQTAINYPSYQDTSDPSHPEYVLHHSMDSAVGAEVKFLQAEESTGWGYIIFIQGGTQSVRMNPGLALRLLTDGPTQGTIFRDNNIVKQSS